MSKSKKRTKKEIINDEFNNAEARETADLQLQELSGGAKTELDIEIKDANDVLNQVLKPKMESANASKVLENAIGYMNQKPKSVFGATNMVNKSAGLRLKLRKLNCTHEELNTALTVDEVRELKDMLNTKYGIITVIRSLRKGDNDDIINMGSQLQTDIKFMLNVISNSDVIILKDAIYLMNDIDAWFDSNEGFLTENGYTFNKILDQLIDCVHPESPRLKIDAGRVKPHKTWDREKILNNVKNTVKKYNIKQLYPDTKLYITFETHRYFRYRENGFKDYDYPNLVKYKHNIVVQKLSNFKQDIIDSIPVVDILSESYTRKLINKLKSWYYKFKRLDAIDILERTYKCKVEQIDDIIVFKFEELKKTLMFRLMGVDRSNNTFPTMIYMIDNNESGFNISFDVNFVLDSIDIVSSIIDKYSEYLLSKKRDNKHLSDMVEKDTDEKVNDLIGKLSVISNKIKNNPTNTDGEKPELTIDYLKGIVD